ncbi:MAG: hypothetical protein LC708_00940 [Actinobacteria bacterium]|nr:hypothetical protein [Actinomycetota bacterium]
MRLGDRLELRVRQSGAAGTLLEFRLEGLELAGEPDEDATDEELDRTPRDRLDLDDVKRLRDACDDVLERRPLPR